MRAAHGRFTNYTVGISSAGIGTSSAGGSGIRTTCRIATVNTTVQGTDGGNQGIAAGRPACRNGADTILVAAGICARLAAAGSRARVVAAGSVTLVCAGS